MALLMSKKAATRLDDDDLLIPTRKKRKKIKITKFANVKKISRHAIKNASDFMGQVADFNKYHKHVFISPKT